MDYTKIIWKLVEKPLRKFKAKRLRKRAAKIEKEHNLPPRGHA